MGLTVSSADRMPTRGWLMPSDRARLIAFWTISTLVSSDGRMLIAASLTSSRWSMPGTSITKMWLILRFVRRPVPALVTSCSNSSE